MNDFLHNLISQSPVVQGGLTLMIAGWLGYQLRAFPARLWQFIRSWTTRVVEIRESHPFYDAWLSLLTEAAVRPGGPRTLEVRRRRDVVETQSPTAILAAGRDDFWARMLGRWCHVHIYREEGSSNPGSLIQHFMITVEVLFGTRADLERMSAEAARRANVMEHRQLVDVYDRYGGTTTVTLAKRDPATLCLPRGLFESIESRVRDFCSARKQYEQAGLPWRFGLLFTGEPGTGKTTLAHALASRLNLRLAVITLADIQSDSELATVFRGITDQAIVLIEDVDCAFQHRENEETGVSFSGLLNCIDGMLAPDNGRILVMSTNHIDRLDPALIRPGRIDMRVEAPLLTREAASDYVDRVFPHIAARHDIVNEVLASHRATPAALINRLMQEHWHRRITSKAPEAPRGLFASGPRV